MTTNKGKHLLEPLPALLTLCDRKNLGSFQARRYQMDQATLH